MGGLRAAIPNLDVPLFILAPEAKRSKVFAELTRPLFQLGLETPLEDSCQYVSFDSLSDALDQYGESKSIDVVRLMREMAKAGSLGEAS